MIGELFAIFAVLTFVGSNVLFRKVEQAASPTYINLFRTAIGTLTFIIVALLVGSLFDIFLLPFELWILLFVSFLFGQVIGDTAYFYAQKELGTTLALALSMTFPLFTFVLSLIFLNRPIELNLILSLVLIGAGITIIGRYKIKAEENNRPPEARDRLTLIDQVRKTLATTSFKAITFGFIASIGWAVGLVIIDHATNQINQILLTEGVSSIIANVIRFPFALFVLTLMVWRENASKGNSNPSIIQKKTFKTWSILLGASIIGTSIGAFLYTEAARMAGANFMSLLASASPVFSLPLTYWINKEKISKEGFVGVVLTVIGVLVILL
jgi:drug/metabolite transporter (DMT)-like permease